MSDNTQTTLELRQTLDELNVHVKALRDRAEEQENALDTLVEARTTGLAAKIEELRTKQTELELRLKQPPVQAPEERVAQRRQDGIEALRAWMAGGERWAQLPQEKRALVSDSTGQILIPEELETEIMRDLPQLNVIRGLAGTRTTGSDRIRIRSLTEVAVGWAKLEIGDDPTESTLVPGQDYLYVRDQVGLTKVGINELEDADYDIAAHIRDSFGVAFADAEHAGFVNGNPTLRQPEGVLNRVGTNAWEIEKQTVDSSGNIDFEDLLKTAYKIDSQYRTGAVWLMNSDAELALMLLVDGEARYMWQPSVQAGVPSRIWGYPVYVSDDMPTLQAGSGPYVIFGNWARGYRIVDRRGMLLKRLEEIEATAGLVCFLATRRVGGGVIRPDAFAVLGEA